MKKIVCTVLFASFAFLGCGTELGPIDGEGGTGGQPPVCDEGEVCTNADELCGYCYTDGCNDCTNECEVCEVCEVCPEPCEDRCFVVVPGECEKVCTQERWGRCCEWETVCTPDTLEQIECPVEEVS